MPLEENLPIKKFLKYIKGTNNYEYLTAKLFPSNFSKQIGKIDVYICWLCMRVREYVRFCMHVYMCVLKYTCVHMRIFLVLHMCIYIIQVSVYFLPVQSVNQPANSTLAEYYIKFSSISTSNRLFPSYSIVSI